MKFIRNIRDKRRQKFLDGLESQRHPFSDKQVRKLTKCVPKNMLLQDWLVKWVNKNNEKQQVEEAHLRNFIKTVTDYVKWQEAREQLMENKNSNNNVIIMPTPVVRHSPLRWLAACVACVLCLAFILPFFFPNQDIDTPAQRPEYRDWNVVKRTHEHGVDFDYLYGSAINKNLLMFNVPLLEADSVRKELHEHHDGSRDLLSYVFEGMIVVANTNNGPMLFTVDFRIRFVEEYNIFEEYKDFFGAIVVSCDLVDVFYIDTTQILLNLDTTNNIARLRFSAYSVYHGHYICYFISVSPFGEPAVTDVTQPNLELLIADLINN